MSAGERIRAARSALFRCVAVLSLAAGLALPAHGGGPLQLVNHVPVVYPNGGTSLTLNLDQGPLGSRTNAQATAIVQNAIAMWNGVATSTMRLNIGSPLAADYTIANYGNVFQKFSDGLNPIIFDTDGSITDAIFGVGAKTNVLGFAGSAYFTSGPSAGKYAEGQAVLNGSIAVSDATWTVVLAHEIGHFFGLDHSQLDGTQGLAQSNYVLMYPIAYRTLQTLHEDDISAVTSLYPTASVGSIYGQLTGTFTTAGGTPILGANIWARENSTGKVYSIVSDFLTQGNGYFRLYLPAGTYTLNAESIATNFTGGSSVGPYSESSSDASFLSPHPITPVALGGGTPQAIAISAGCLATATFRLDGTGSVSGNCAGSTPSPTMTSLASSGTPAVAGAVVTFTATVVGAAPTGTVNFKDGGATITGCGTVALSGSGNSKTATCPTSNLAVGVHSIVVSYSGDPGNAASSSAPLSQVITSTAVPAAATFVGTDVTTKGTWHGIYGTNGYNVINDSTSYPAYAQVTPSGQQSCTWAAQSDADTRTLQRGVAPGRIAACWYSPGTSGGSFSVDINLTDGAAHRVGLYLLDWDAIARITRVDVLDATTQQVLSTQTLQAYSGGVYLLWNLQGHVTLRFTALAGPNAVLSGLFFDAPASLTTYTVSGTVTTGGNPLPGVNFAATGTASCPNASNAQGQYSCTVPQGWSGSITPSLSGYAFTPAARTYSSVAANQTGQNYTASAPLPNGATFVGTDVTTKGTWHGVYGADGYAVINDSTSYPAYAQVTPSGQQSCLWAAQSDADTRTLQRGVAAGRLAACWFSPGTSGGSFSVDINLTDGAAHRVGLYLLDWDAIARITRVDVLDAATQQVLSTQTLQAYSGGVYLLWNLQGHVTLRFTALAGPNAVLSGLFFDAPASLTTYTVSGTVTSGGNPLSGVNFSAPGNACTASNAQGQYSCTVPQGWSGSITPSLSGYAFTPAARTYSSVAANQTGQNYTAAIALPNGATFVGTDVTTKGTWHGVYGADGYAVINDSTSYPAYAQVTPSGQLSYTWAAQTDADPRTLQRATTGRLAACWYSPGTSGGSFSVDINLTDGAAHRVGLYLLDWDAIARITRVDVLDAATQQVLSTQTLQAYSGGVYLLWNLQGHVTLRFTALAGPNAVLSGLFFGQ